MNASRKKFTKSPLGTINPLKLGKKAEFETKANTTVLSRYSDSMVLAAHFCSHHLLGAGFHIEYFFFK